MFKKILASLVMTLCAFSVQAYEISTKVGSSMSITSGVSNYTATGTIKTITDSSRGIYSYDAHVLSVGSMVKHSTETVNVDQTGTTLFTGAGSTLYAGITHGNIEVGGSVGVGIESSVAHSNDYSVINTVATDTTNVDHLLFGFIPVGSFNEVKLTNTSVQLDNYTKVETDGSWLATNKYIK